MSPPSSVPIAISVLTPSLDYGRFLGDAIASVAAQGQGIEHIVQDGGSTDTSIEVLRTSGIAHWESAPDEGMSDALNLAFARASGEWIAWLNADEFYLPDGLRRLLRAAESTGADVAYGDLIDVDERGRLLSLRAQHRLNTYSMRTFGPHIASCAVLLRRAALGDRPWDPTLRVAMDWDLYLGLMQQGARFTYVPRPIAAFARHDEQVAARPEMWRLDDRTIIERHALHRTRASEAAGLAVHRAQKIASGAFARQLRARPFRGRDMRWFREDVGPADAEAMIRAAAASGAR